MGSNSTRTAYLVEQYLEPVFRLISEVIQSGVRAGEFKSMPAPFLSSLLLAAATHFFTMGAVMGPVFSLDVGDKDHCETHGDWIVEVLFDGLTRGKDIEAASVTSISRSVRKRRANAK